jgi:serine protease Do
MRKAFAAGTAVVAVAAAAFVLAPAAWTQTKEPYADEHRRVFMLDGRGSSIGVSIRDLEANDATNAKSGPVGGVVIEDVEEDSPAAKAGLKRGDVVVEFDGERVRSARHFARLVQETPDGRSVKTTIVRDGARQSVDVTPKSDSVARSGDLMHLPKIADDVQREVERSWRAMPRDFAFDFNWEGETPEVAVFPRGRLGARLMPLSDQLAQYFGTKQGVLVSSVDEDSPAAKAGLKAGDVITSVGGAQVQTPGDVARELREGDSGDVEIAVLRDKKSLTLKATVPERRRIERRSVRPA